MSGLQPYQQRVVEERAALAEKFDKLTAFLASETSQGLPAAEKELLYRQHDVMNQYIAVLDRRIRGFTGTKAYKSHKRVFARPMTRGDYNALRGWDVPADENPLDEGYLVEYIDGGTANHPDFPHYISWSPKDVFDRGYKEVAG